MTKIVRFKNDYYLYDGLDFYGPFHSVNEAEMKNPEKEKYKTSPLQDFKFIKTLAY